MSSGSTIVIDMRSTTMLVWVPHGWVVAPLFCLVEAVDVSAGDEAKSDQPAPQVQDIHDTLTFVWSLAVWSSPLFNELLDTAWAPLVAVNTARFEKMGAATSSVWGPRQQRFTQLCSDRTTQRVSGRASHSSAGST